MLSKVFSQEEVPETQELTRFTPPSEEQLQELMEISRQRKKREKVIDENPDDPVSAARKAADEILKEAQEKYQHSELEASMLKIKAEKEIREKLTQEFEAKLNEAVKDANQNFIDSLSELAALKGHIYRNSEDKLMALVFEIASKVIGTKIETTPDLVIEMLRKGFEAIKSASRYEISIHPSDYEILMANKQRVEQLIRPDAEVKFVKSESVEKGGCVLKTELGEVIAEPLKQLNIIKKELQGS